MRNMPCVQILEDMFFSRATGLLQKGAAEAAADGGAGPALRSVVAWEEAFYTSDGAWRGSQGLPPNGTVIETWTGSSVLAQVSPLPQP